MIELTEEQIQALEKSAGPPPRLVNPRTRQTFVLLPVEEYQRLKAVDYDDNPPSREERDALLWQYAEKSGWDDYGDYQPTPDKP